MGNGGCGDFDASSLIEYESMTRDPILIAIRNEPFLTQPREVELQQEQFEEIFGTFGDDHAFTSFRPDWGVKLQERQVTGALAYLLARCTGPDRGRRMRAFLEALKVPELPDDNNLLERTRVVVEEKHVDLSIRLPVDTAGRSRIVLIEAKFESSIHAGQLRRYYKAYPNYDRCCRIVALNPNVASGLKGRQHDIWRIVLWRDLWLKFEKKRPTETDGQLGTFQAWLWQRIGGLKLGQS